MPNVLSPRDLVFRPENMDETVPHAQFSQNKERVDLSMDIMSRESDGFSGHCPVRLECVQGIGGQCPWAQWTMSMDSVDNFSPGSSGRLNNVDGQCSLSMSMDIVHCTLDFSSETMDIVQCTLDFPSETMDIVHCTLDFSSETMDNVHCTLDFSSETMDIVHFTLDSVDKVHRHCPVYMNSLDFVH